MAEGDIFAGILSLLRGIGEGQMSADEAARKAKQLLLEEKLINAKMQSEFQGQQPVTGSLATGALEAAGLPTGPRFGPGGTGPLAPGQDIIQRADVGLVEMLGKERGATQRAGMKEVPSRPYYLNLATGKLSLAPTEGSVPVNLNDEELRKQVAGEQQRGLSEKSLVLRQAMHRDLQAVRESKQLTEMERIEVQQIQEFLNSFDQKMFTPEEVQEKKNRLDVIKGEVAKRTKKAPPSGAKSPDVSLEEFKKALRQKP